MNNFYNRVLKLDFAKVFRKIALDEKNTYDLTIEEQDLLHNNGIIKTKEDISFFENLTLSDILFDNNSAQLFWFLKCMDSQENKLYEMSGYLKDISKIKRGGLNIYKRVGWDTHVLYAYQLVTSNFAKNTNISIIGAPDDFSYYHKIFNSLSNEAKFILKIGTFLHDIGVVDGVSDHETKGIKWVEQRYFELGITDKHLKDNNIFLTENEIIPLLKFIVGNHQIMNQIGSEISDLYVYERIREAKEELRHNKKAYAIFEEYIAEILLLLSAADIMAVNDILLTPEKIVETKESFDYFKYILKNNYSPRSISKIGIQRYRSLLSDSKKNQLSDDLFVSIVCSLNYNVDELLRFFYEIKQLSYAMTVIKPQKEIDIGIKLFCIINEYLKKYNLLAIKTKIKFHPDIDSEKIYSNLKDDNNLLLCKDWLKIIQEDDNIYINVE